MKSGDLTERVTISSRVEMNPDAPNDYGNTVAEWVDQGTVWAGFTFLRGGENVMASRLSGKQPVVIRVRSSAFTRQITTDWRVTDARTGTAYAIRAVNPNPDKDRAAIDLLCESGVAA